MTARRAPRATALEVVVSSGERVRLSGRLAEVLAYLAVQLAAHPNLAHADFWKLEAEVSRAKVFCRFSETHEPWGFRSDHAP